jgi:hypothetical protein
MKVASALLASVMIFGVAIGSARAEICYRLTPFPDILRLAETTFDDPATGGSHTLVVGAQIVHNVYSLPLVGAIELNTGSTTVLHFTAHAVNRTTSFGNHADCILDGLIGVAGSESISCDGRVAGIFNNGLATLTPISCSGLSPSLSAEPPSGRAQGE